MYIYIYILEYMYIYSSLYTPNKPKLTRLLDSVFVTRV